MTKVGILRDKNEVCKFPSYAFMRINCLFSLLVAYNNLKCKRPPWQSLQGIRYLKLSLIYHLPKNTSQSTPNKFCVIFSSCFHTFRIFVQELTCTVISDYLHYTSVVVLSIFYVQKKAYCLTRSTRIKKKGCRTLRNRYTGNVYTS